MAMANDVKIMDSSTESFDHKMTSVEFNSCVLMEDSAALDLCLICHHSQNVSQAKQLITEYFNWSRDYGVECDSLSCLDANLLSVFVLRNVLNYPESECVKIFETTLGAVNPADWFVLCEPCLELIKQIYQLEMELEGLKLKVRKQLKTSFAKEEKHEREGAQGGGGDILSIREMIRNFFKGKNFHTQLPFVENVSAGISNGLQLEEPMNPSSVHQKRLAQPIQSRIKSSIQKRNRRDRHEKSKPKVQRKIKPKVEICNETKEPKIEQINFDTADKVEDTCWSSNMDFEESDEDRQEDKYNPPAPKNCSKRISSKRTLTFRCPDCSEVFFTPSKRQEHRIAVHQAPSGSFKCEICLKHFPTKAVLKGHAFVAHQYRNIPHRCEICDKVFSSKWNYTEHVNAVHSDEKSFTCETCGFSANTKGNLNRHQRIHDKRFTCAHCGRKFTDKQSLKIHMPVHTGLVFTCEECGHKFNAKKYLQKHVQKYHTGDNPPPVKPQTYVTRPRLNLIDKSDFAASGLTSEISVDAACISGKCEICLEYFPTTEALKGHVYEAHGNRLIPHRCEICDKVLSSRWNYSEHINAVHREEKQFTCEICGFSTTSNRHLNRHRSSHDKKFVCSHCDRKFSHKKALDNHVGVHTGEVIVCDEYGQQFHARRYLLRHMRKYHYGDNPPRVKPKKQQKKQRFKHA